jgi:DNA helicase-2/ATP-dependent DNA helicase PcrA
LPGDLRIYAHCKNLLAYTLLNLLADGSDLVAWRSWCGFGDALARSNLWLRLETYAEKNSLGELEALAALAGLDEMPFAGADILAQRYLEGNRIIKANADKVGHALLNATTPRGEEFPADVLALIEPIAGNETAGDFYGQAAKNLTEPVFDAKGRVRIGLWETLAGLTVPVLVLPGLVDGLIPPGAAFDTSSAFDRSRVMDSCRYAFHTTLTKSSDKLVLSYFHRAPLEQAEALGIRIVRIKIENGQHMASTSPSMFLDEMGDSLPPAASGLLA